MSAKFSGNVLSAVNILQGVAEAIREVGEVPSGVLYSRLMGIMSLQQYEKIIGILKGAGVVAESGCLLRWVDVTEGGAA